MVYTTLGQKRKQFRTIYEVLLKTPRIKITPLSKILKLRRSTIRKRLKEALEKGYIIGPHLKRKSYRNFSEYMYFVECENPLESYLEYVEDQNVVYHAVMDGFANLWLITNKEIDIDGNVIAFGPRSDYHISYAPDHSWEKAIQTMWEMVKGFKHEKYTQKEIIKTHWDETVKWRKIDEILFKELKYNFRKPLTPIIQSHHIHKDRIVQWLEKLPECCTVATFYNPESISGYDPYLFMFETDYEDFIIDLFSQLPTSSFFFKVADKLFSHLLIDRQYLRNVDSGINDFSQLHIPLIIRELSKRGILQRRARAVIAYHWRKDL